ncbi:MAG: Chaperone protein ClpB [Pelotomaculum sp. PtaU1.Bin035]|nr:MAG: Chaperone protein ClpB [Pelotomaculum sp. PtaU1.Bin035]
MQRSESLPRWLRELERYLPIKTLFLLYGNCFDKLLYPIKDREKTRWVYLNLRELLHRFFLDRKYYLLGVYDIVDGLTFLSEQEGQRFKTIARGKSVDWLQKGREPASNDREDGCNFGGGSPHQALAQHYPARGVFLQDFDAALDSIRNVMANRDVPAAIAIDFASRLVSAPGQLLQKERQQFVKLLKCVTEASRVNIDGEAYNNVIVLICEKLNDLPAWLYLNNPLAKSIRIDRPSDGERRRYFEMTAGAFYGYDDVKEQDLEKTIQSFVDLTYGMGNYELESLRLLSLKESISFNKPQNIIESYKFGVKENKWEQLRKNKFIGDAEVILQKRVKGQDAAIRTVVDIIKRAAVGMSGIQHSSSAHKPRGILFFAGPTGVGKTELAKALAELLFGDENACTRFDMSEYALEHADQKLLGAPPGYVGYEEGGQLANKVKESPFSVLLFDEIEKAHPKILDKFLQILEDGRMTDGKGEVVYFSESIIVFTSNIGAYIDIPVGDGQVIRKPNVLPYSWRCRKCNQIFIEESVPALCHCGEASFEEIQTSYNQVKEKILKAIEEHFKFKLGRPEIYNRIGNNFVVFDYIRTDVVDQIINKILDGIAGKMDEQKDLKLRFAEPVYNFLRERAFSNAELGGRGIGNLIETVLVNPLAGEIFDRGIEGGSLLVKNIIERKQDGNVIAYCLEID